MADLISVFEYDHLSKSDRLLAVSRTKEGAQRVIEARFQSRLEEELDCSYDEEELTEDWREGLELCERAVLIVDKEPCAPYCRRSGGLSVLAARGSLEELVVIWRSAVGEGLFSWGLGGPGGLQPITERPDWVDEVLHAAEAGLGEVGLE